MLCGQAACYCERSASGSDMGDAIKVKTSSVLMYAGDETAPHNDAMRLSLKRERVGNPANIGHSEERS